MNTMKKMVFVLVLGQSSHAGSYLQFLLRQELSGSQYSGHGKAHASESTPVTSSASSMHGANGASAPGGVSGSLTKQTAAGPLLSASFNVQGPNYPIGRMFVSGNNLFATGGFTAIGKTPAYGVAEWDGREWKGLGEGFLEPVACMAFSDSLIFAGGYFGKAGGAAIPYLAQWNGSQWASVGPVALQKPVFAMAYSGGSLFVGVEGKAADSITGVASWNGSGWSSLGGGCDSVVYCLKPAGSGVIAGGNFTRIGGISAAGVAQWAQGQWHSLGAGLHGRVTELEIFDGDVFAAGYFRLLPDSSMCRFARWNGSGWACVDVDPTHRYILPPVVTDLTSDNGFLYASAAVHATEQTLEYQTYRFDRSQWTPLGPFTEAGVSVESSEFASLAAYKGNILLAGDFSKLGAKAIQGLAKWDGTAWIPWPEGSEGMGVGNFVSVLASNGSGILAGGAFSSAGGKLMNGLASIDGAGWTDLGFPDSLTANGGVISITGSGGNIFTASFVRSPTSSPRAIRVRRLQAGQWTTLGEAHSRKGETSFAELLSRDGGIFAAGRFDTIGGVPARNIAYWDGQNWHALGRGLNGRCRALEWDNGSVYAGGDFDSAGTSDAQKIARWNGSAWSQLGPNGADGVQGISAVSVNVIRKQGGRLVVGGSFRGAGGIESRNISSWSSSDGWEGNWDTYESGVVQDIVVQDDSVLFLAYTNGMRGTDEGYTGIAKWSGKEWSPISSRIRFAADDGAIHEGVVQSLALTGTDLYAGGTFNMIGNVPSNHIARWSLSGGNRLRPIVAGEKGGLERLLLIGSITHGNARRFLEKNPGALISDLSGRRVQKIPGEN